MTTIKTLLIGTATAAALAAMPASAALLKFEIIDPNGATYDTFQLDSDAGKPNYFEGYALFDITGSTRGFNGAYFGAPDTGYAFGIGSIWENGLAVEAGYADYARFFTLDGLKLSITADSVVTSDGYTVNVAAVPEPATWGLMLMGFGMVAGAARYRRRRVGATFA